MSTANPPSAPANARVVALRVRPDLQFERQTHQGLIYWMVKDPVSLQYFKLEEEQYAALRMLDGRQGFVSIRDALRRRFPSETIEDGDLRGLLRMFAQMRLVITERPGQGGQLFLQRCQKHKQWLLAQAVGGVLFMRLPGFDPDRLLTWLDARLRWVFRPLSVAAAVLFALSALSLVTMHFDELSRRLPEFRNFFGPGNFVWLALAMAFAKILHEFGHGVACKHFGGECHQIGLMLLVFTPSLYCDTSDSWMLPNKWRRAAIGAAGMYVEVVLASICTFVWWNTDPGFVHYMCLNLMFVSSVSTLFVNLNPLLRFDGYFILSDLLEIPNLAEHSRQVVLGTLQNWFLGIPLRHEQTATGRQWAFFTFYSVASLAYRVLMVVGISWFLMEVFASHGVKIVGQALMGLCLFGVIVVPLIKLVRFFRVPGRMQQVNMVRFAILGTLLISALAALLLVPIPHYVFVPAIAQPRDAQRVYVRVPGLVSNVRVRPGSTVVRGEELAELLNADFQQEIERLESERAAAALRLKNLRRLQSSDAAAAERIPETSEMLASLTDRLSRLRADGASLKLRASRDGVVMSPPRSEAPQIPEDEVLPFWSGTPLDPENQGGWLQRGTLFCLIGDPRSFEARLVIAQTEIQLVRQGQTVDIKFDGYPHRTWHGVIAAVSLDEMRSSPPELSQRLGGELSTQVDAMGRERPMRTSYEAEFALDNEEGFLQPSLRGRAKIHVGRRSLGWRLLRFIAQSLRFS